MSTAQVDEHRAYRSGLLLGFTLTEVVLLLIFALLLALGMFLVKVTQRLDTAEERARRETAAREAAEARAEAAAVLVERVRSLGGRNGTNEFDDMFHELVVVTQEVRRTREQGADTAALHEKARQFDQIRELVASGRNEPRSTAPPVDVVTTVRAALEQVRSGSETDLRQEATTFRTIRDAAQQAGMPTDGASAQQVGAAVAAVVAEAGQLRRTRSTEHGARTDAVDPTASADTACRASNAAGDPPTGCTPGQTPGPSGDRTAPSAAAAATALAVWQQQTVEQMRQAGEQVATLTGQVQFLQSQQKGLGKGASYPPCWINPETLKPDYVFDIDMLDGGLRVRDAAPAHRRDEVAALPLAALTFEAVLSPGQFLTATRPLFQQSERDNCRHFVRVFDATSVKSTYKQDLLTVESHFYKREVR